VRNGSEDLWSHIRYLDGVATSRGTLGDSLGGAYAAAFAIDADTADITLAVSPDFKALADADGDNTYALTVAAADPDGGPVTV
jgi:hypothetical protein